MSVQTLLTSWRAEPSIAANIETWHSMPARPAQFEPLPDNLHPALQNALISSGIRSLYTHQSDAWQYIHLGNNIVVVTGTASGKTLCYNLPVLDKLLRDPETRALYIFPTKALTQDQLQALQEFSSRLGDLKSSADQSRQEGNRSIQVFSGHSGLSIPAAIYDGDTPSSARSAIRSKARLLFTNPDMLHTGILPHHTNWAEFFQNLQFVVIDEMHAYRGVFGSHVANVIRRLKRIAAFYGASPRFIMTSATIANPVELAERFIEESVALVDRDGAGRGAKNFLIYNPPIVNAELGLRRSALQESVRLAEDLLAQDIQTIIFARSRRSVELVLTYLRQRPVSPISTTHENSEEVIRGYRSGYLPQQRREIERGLRQGVVRAVVATNALELGIDIGGMGAALLVGYPGTVAATWQQAGRAGRGDLPSLAVLVATADPLDQFLAHHPDYFFGRSPEQALINPDNLLILLDHLRCAAFELPFQDGERFGDNDGGRVLEFLEFLREEGVLHQSGRKYYWMADRYPAEGISLRSASVSNVTLQVSDPDGTPTTIGEVDRASAFWMVHPQSVYLHEGQMYVVDELDLEQNIARLRRASVDYYTEPRRETTVQLIEKQAEEKTLGAIKAYGEISVTTQMNGYRKVRWYTHEQLGIGELDLPPTELQTTGYWLALSEQTVERLRQEGMWRNDPNDYGPKWARQRELARARDDYRCQVCGVPEQGRSHDVHHKTPFRTFFTFQEGTPANNLYKIQELANRLDNLITVCPACHQKIETAVRVRSGLAGLAHVFGHLAPFFLMCDVNDLGVHSDPQSPLSEGCPTVVLYDQVPAGIGFSQRLFELHDELILRAYELVSACECQDGCPSCVGPGGENGLGGKQETLAILRALTQE